jgi:hypothetical protein
MRLMSDPGHLAKQKPAERSRTPANELATAAYSVCTVVQPGDFKSVAKQGCNSSIRAANSINTTSFRLIFASFDRFQKALDRPTMTNRLSAFIY